MNVEDLHKTRRLLGDAASAVAEACRREAVHVVEAVVDTSELQTEALARQGRAFLDGLWAAVDAAPVLGINEPKGLRVVAATPGARLQGVPLVRRGPKIFEAEVSAVVAEDNPLAATTAIAVDAVRCFLAQRQPREVSEGEGRGDGEGSSMRRHPQRQLWEQWQQRQQQRRRRRQQLPHQQQQSHNTHCTGHDDLHAAVAFRAPQAPRGLDDAGIAGWGCVLLDGWTSSLHEDQDLASVAAARGGGGGSVQFADDDDDDDGRCGWWSSGLDALVPALTLAPTDPPRGDGGHASSERLFRAFTASVYWS